MWQIVAVQAIEAIAAVPVFSGEVAEGCHGHFKLLALGRPADSRRIDKICEK
jgi:hypothetical protein